MTDPSDAELVRRSRDGDRTAFAALYDRHARLARAVALDAGPAAVPDVVQETFLRAWRGLAGLRAGDQFPSWLAGIARRVVREHRRRPTPGPLADSPAPDDPSVDSADEAVHLLALVNRLPPDQRLAVRLFFLGGEDVAAVATRLGRSRSGTYALIQTARRTLAGWLTPEDLPR